MSKAPERCLYCDGTDPNCGFCEMGKPLDTQEDWDNSWGRTFDIMSDPNFAGRVEERSTHHAITAFLIEGDYNGIDEWMLDSDWTLEADGITWNNGFGAKTTNPDAIILEAMDACGFLSRYFAHEIRRSDGTKRD